MSQSKIQNHVAIVLDRSSSMSSIMGTATSVVENVINHLKNNSVKFNQETRISLYVFDNNAECLIYNMDALRFSKLERIHVRGMTALVDAVALAIDDLQKIPQLYCDHAFMLYVITDGQENASRMEAYAFQSKLNSLPDNFTIVGYAPDNMAKLQLVNLGFHKGNVDLWETTQRGLQDLEKSISNTVDRYFTLRSTGQKSSNAILSDLSSVKKSQVTKTLRALTSSQYSIIKQDVDTKAVQIRTLVEDKTKKSYVAGNSYYELVKTETIQPGKSIVIQDNSTKKVYTGDEARQLLGLPDHEVKVKPGDHGNWTVYVQSTSFNRNVIPHQRVLVLK